MKKIALIIISILFLSGLFYRQGVSKYDEVYRQNIVGYWVNSNDMPYAIVVFLTDGIGKVLVYESINSKNLKAKIETKWWIQNGRLFSEIIKMIPLQQGLYEGYIFENQIIEINDKEMILIDEYGLEKINYRNEDTNFDQLWSE